MKTNFHPKNRGGSSYKKRFLIICALFIALAVVFSFSGGLFIRLVSPLWKGESAFALALDRAAGSLRSKDALEVENQQLKEALSSAQTSLSESRADLSSRDEILAHLGRVPAGTGVAASVLMRPPETPYDELMVDAGSNQGVVVGQKVTLPEGPVIGRVTETFATNARVRLLSSSGEKTDAFLERGSVAVSLVGQGGGTFEFDLPRDLDVQVGDKILSADVASVLIGVVQGVAVSPTDSFKKVLVGSLGNPFSLRFVLIR